MKSVLALAVLFAVSPVPASTYGCVVWRIPPPSEWTISGVVRYAESGRPVANVEVTASLVWDRDPDCGLKRRAWTDRDGNFRIVVEDLRSYRLYVDLSPVPADSSERRFYPGVSEKKDATLIMQKNSEHIEFLIPEPPENEK